MFKNANFFSKTFTVLNLQKGNILVCSKKNQLRLKVGVTEIIIALKTNS